VPLLSLWKANWDWGKTYLAYTVTAPIPTCRAFHYQDIAAPIPPQSFVGVAWQQAWPAARPRPPLAYSQPTFVTPPSVQTAVPQVVTFSGVTPRLALPQAQPTFVITPSAAATTPSTAVPSVVTFGFGGQRPSSGLQTQPTFVIPTTAAAAAQTYIAYTVTSPIIWSRAFHYVDFVTSREPPPAAPVEPPTQGGGISGGYFSRGRWHEVKTEYYQNKRLLFIEAERKKQEARYQRELADWKAGSRQRKLDAEAEARRKEILARAEADFAEATKAAVAALEEINRKAHEASAEAIYRQRLAESVRQADADEEDEIMAILASLDDE
jgi:hypothetical protein